MKPLHALGSAAIALAFTSGCEVSFFGNEPITFGMSGVVTPGGEAQPCAEPEDARVVREDESECAERCRIENGAVVGECELVTIGEDGIATLDVSQVDGLVMRLELCDPMETVLQVADARDPTTSSHDASMLLTGTTLTVRASEGSGVEASRLEGWIAERGCTTRTIEVSEQMVYFADTERGLCGTGLFRISPPTDEEGTPDATWFVSLAGSIDGSASGSGLRAIDLCAW